MLTIMIVAFIMTAVTVYGAREINHACEGETEGELKQLEPMYKTI